jgi:allantoinase
MGEGPAKLAGCRRKGRIVPGHDADFCVLDTESEFVVSEERLHFRHRVSPYLRERLRGVVKATYLRGEMVYADGQFCGKARGTEYAHD